MSPLALLFDLDDTLVPERPRAEAIMRAVCQTFAAEHNADPQALADAVFQIARPLWHACPHRSFCRTVGLSSWEALWGPIEGAQAEIAPLRRWVPTYRLQTWRDALGRFCSPSDDLVGRMSQAFAAQRAALHHPYEESPAVLHEMASRFRIACVTNGLSSIQRRKLDGSGLADVFHAVVIAGDIGMVKPDAAPFRAALSALGVEPDQAVMIGNSLRSDIAGANQLGMPSIWVNRDAEPPDPAIRPTREIACLQDLPDALESLIAVWD